ncbi:MAG: endonuclease/exonuclease/phosphatase family protein [Planctomycetota bacterium]|jgi:endonuclease/exonuclease/phosphatase family metal-dependent hydrolase
MTIRIATFNCENLFARFRFRGNFSPNDASRDGFTINNVTFGFHDRAKRRITANAVKALNADVVALQEVENLDVLERFRSQFLGGFRAFPHVMLVDGNDPRFIDVAMLSKHPIVHARSYQHLKSSPRSRSFVFSRDCLEADVDFSGNLITFYVNHFKSMLGGRASTRRRRLGQVRAVRRIVTDQFGSRPGSEPFVVLGDFNDYIEEGDEAASSLPELVQWNQVENVVERLDPTDRWTHFYPRENAYRQLDYILVSNALRRSVTSVEIERRGMPRRADRFTGRRFRGVGQNNPKASDHCPVVVELDI